MTPKETYWRALGKCPYCRNDHAGKQTYCHECRTVFSVRNGQQRIKRAAKFGLPCWTRVCEADSPIPGKRWRIRFLLANGVTGWNDESSPELRPKGKARRWTTKKAARAEIEKDHKRILTSMNTSQSHE